MKNIKLTLFAIHSNLVLLNFMDVIIICQPASQVIYFRFWGNINAEKGKLPTKEPIADIYFGILIYICPLSVTGTDPEELLAGPTGY